jgi:hypothetical protein
VTPRPPEPQPDLSTSETEPLPPLPDGGLAQAMPDWLRAEPPSPSPPAASVAVTDPTGFITEDDLPEWLRQLSPSYTAPVPCVEPSPSQGPPPSCPTPTPPVTLPVVQPSPGPATLPRRSETAPVVHYTRASSPEPSSRRRIVAVAGVLLLALGVLAYLYATRGGF